MPQISNQIRILLVACALAGSACSGAVADQKTQTGASALSKAPVASTAHGPVKIVGEALGEVSLRADQRTALEALAASAETRHAAMAPGRKDLIDTLAAQIEAGAIDRAALQPKIDLVTKETAAARVDDRAAIATAHDLLDPEQRNDLVDALHAKMKEMRGEKGFGRLMELKADLKLTDDQVSQIKDVVKDELKGHRGEWKGKHGAKKPLDAFRADKLDAAAMPEEHLTEGAARVVGVAEKVLPILTPEQRKIAADKLRTLQDMPF